jgi:hypothetical protein
MHFADLSGHQGSNIMSSSRLDAVDGSTLRVVDARCRSHRHWHWHKDVEE